MAIYSRYINTFIGLFGKQLGSKLFRWLDPCCSQFCEDVNACVTAASTTIVTYLPQDTITLTPTSRKTILQFSIPVSTTFNIALSTIAESQLGDLLIICFTTNSISGVQINLDSNFFLTTCGSYSASIPCVANSRRVIPFIFDGVSFVNTFDNC